jgi:hypothetical protein
MFNSKATDTDKKLFLKNFWEKMIGKFFYSNFDFIQVPPFIAQQVDIK